MSTTVEQLSEQLTRLEREVAAIRRQLAQIEPRAASELPQAAAQSGRRLEWTDKQLLREAFDRLFTELGIHGEPIGAIALQRLMQQENLEPNEIGRALIAARDE